MYDAVLERPLNQLDVIRANRPKRLPVVLTREEVKAILGQLDVVTLLIARLLYGSGVRILECLRLRVHDLDFSRSEVFVRGGKGDKDRRTMLPLAAQARLRTHLAEVKALHTADLAAGHGRVMMPEALGEKLQGADRNWGWQWVFPSGNLPEGPETGIVGRHHLNESAVGRAISESIRQQC